MESIARLERKKTCVPSDRNTGLVISGKARPDAYGPPCLLARPRTKPCADYSPLLCELYHSWAADVKGNFSFRDISCSLLLCAKELISSDALIFLRRNGGEAMKYECLKLEERRIIEEMYAKGAKPGEIAERVGKCQATIYRELERGKTGETDSRFRQGYSAAVAEARVNRSYRNRGRRKAAQ